MALWDKIKADAATYSSLASVCLAIVGIVALIISVEQLRETRRSLQNGLVYTMQKDAREVAADYAAGKNKDGRETSLDEVFASMQSIFLQHKLGSIPDPIWVVFDEDMRKFLTRRNICVAWGKTDRPFLTPEFREYGNKVIGDACKDQQQ